MRAIVLVNGNDPVIVSGVVKVEETEGSVVLKDGEGNNVGSFLVGDVGKIELV